MSAGRRVTVALVLLSMGLTSVASGPHVLVVGGGLAGLTASLEAAKRGARVTLVEKETRWASLPSFRPRGPQS